MFKIPAWEDDVPKSNINFNRKIKKNNLTEEKSPLTNRNVKTKNNKVQKNKSPKQHKLNGKIGKLINKNVTRHHNFKIDKKAKINVGFKTNKYPKNDFKSKGKVVEGSLLRQQKNEKNSEMMNRRLQNKVIKSNTNLSTNPLNKKSNHQLKDRIKLNKINKKSPKSQKKSTHSQTTEENLQNNTNSLVKENKRKRKLTETVSLEIQNFDTEQLDELVINAKKKKINDALRKDDNENELFHESDKPRTNRKKEIFKKLLAMNSTRNHIEVKSNKLRDRMLERLKAAQFRYLNEKLYTSSGTEAQQLFLSDPSAFQTYHQGYQLQVKKWPVNPLDVIVKKIIKMPKTFVIADMGCGEAALSKLVPQSVHSFDLVSSAPGVQACDMARTPLLAQSVDVAVYCLALMGTDLTRYLLEANRILKTGGHLLIAEVESRFEDVEAFSKEVQRLGFKLKNLDKSHKVFFFMDFTKVNDPPAKKAKFPSITLKPCLYKRR